jgi:hypothetical protein
LKALIFPDGFQGGGLSSLPASPCVACYLLVVNPRLGQAVDECFCIKLGVGSRTWNSSDIDDQFDPEELEQLDKFLNRTS